MKRYKESFKINEEDGIKKGDMILYNYHHSSHPLDSKQQLIALKVTDIEKKRWKIVYRSFFKW